MKRKIYTMIIVSILFVIPMVMTGCDTKSLSEGNTTYELARTAYEADAEVTHLKLEIEDDAFWDSAEKATELIANTLEDRKDTTIGFRLACSDGSILELDDFANVRLTYINDVWRSLTSDRLLYSLATSDEVTKAHAAGKTVEITGVILKWYQPQGVFDHNDQRVYSVCDLENDGIWDYVTSGKVFFTDVTSAALKDEEGKPLGIGSIDIATTKVVPLTENAKFSELYKLATAKG